MAVEALFYHLEHAPLDRVLPLLVEKTLERGWRAVIQAGSAERVTALDMLLWTYRDDSFLPHGTAADGKPERQPVFLTDTGATPNGAQVRFLVDGATPSAYAGHERFVVLFDGGDPDAVTAARAQWTAAKAAGCTVTYWQQGADGRWEKKA
jgi:DNA polymerase-3 subunit chi